MIRCLGGERKEEKKEIKRRKGERVRQTEHKMNGQNKPKEKQNKYVEK